MSRFSGVTADNLPVLLAVVVVAVSLFLLLSGKRKRPVALDKDEWRPFRLIKKEELTHDTLRLRFALQSENHVLGLPIGQHISFRFLAEDGKEVIRSYTPVTSDDEVGYVDFVIKVYRPMRPNFPEGGKMSQHLDRLKIGETIEMRGPKGSIEYLGKGVFSIRRGRNVTTKQVKKVGFISGGTGITPSLQVITAMLKESRSPIEISLLFANKTEDDILVRDIIEHYAKEHGHRFRRSYTLDTPPAGWAFESGFVNADMIRKHMPAPEPGSFIFMCGPPPMIERACKPALVQVGFSEDDFVAF